jgi:long-chain acyl-CoA synthetase
LQDTTHDTPRGDRPARIEGDTIVAAFRNTVRRFPGRPALRNRVETGWHTTSYADYEGAVAEVTAGLAELGIDAGHHVGIFSNNRPEWHLADFGILANGCVTVPVYQTSSAPQVAHILGDGEAVLCFVEDHDLAARILEVRDELPKLQRIVVFTSDERLDDPFVLGFAQLRAIGAARLLREPDLFDRRAGAVTRDALATLVYTSGTTGPPKGAMISHANIMWTLENTVSLLHVRDGERLLSFLPLSHIAERMISDFAAVAVGGETWFARSLSTIAEDLRDCHPTILFAVPRVWEKLQEAVRARLDDTHGLKKLMVERYVDLGERVVGNRDAAVHVPLWEQLPYDALDLAVGSKIRHALGIDQAHLLISAAAPIHPDLLRWFHAIGLPVLELYGQTETCGPTTCNPPEDNRIGTVGPPVPGVQIRIADDGEILVRGGNVCQGYFNDPDASAALIDDDGWMHSGDAGRIDDHYLTVTGRKKDLIITAHGQNIAPQEIETDLRHHDLIAEAVVVGEGRRYLTALLTLDGDALSAWAAEHHKVGDTEAIASDPDLRAELDAFIARVNAGRSHVEGVRKYRIVAHDFTIAAGEMTPTLKVKRNVVNQNYRAVIDSMYAEG